MHEHKHIDELPTALFALRHIGALRQHRELKHRQINMKITQRTGSEMSNGGRTLGTAMRRPEME